MKCKSISFYTFVVSNRKGREHTWKSGAPRRTEGCTTDSMLRCNGPIQSLSRRARQHDEVFFHLANSSVCFIAQSVVAVQKLAIDSWEPSAFKIPCVALSGLVIASTCCEEDRVSRLMPTRQENGAWMGCHLPREE